MKNKNNAGKTSPFAIICVLGFIWLMRSGILVGFAKVVVSLLSIGLAAAIFFIIRAIARATKDGGQTQKRPVDVSTKGEYQKRAEQAPPVSRPVTPPVRREPKYPPEVQEVVDEGKLAHTELERLYATIPDLAVKAKIRELINVSDKIVEDAVNDPSDVPQIKKFLDYYLPTAIKLLNAYDRMGAQGIEGENISGAMQSIEEMLDTTVAAYKKLLDSLFANQAMDIETDIEVMNTLLKREGLAGGATGFGNLHF